MAEPRGFVRQKAARLFAAEIKGTNFEIPKQGTDQYESQLYLSPTGARASRVFFVGTATEVEDIGQDSSFFRMRVADPTGVAFVTAGQYQPEAARVIQELSGKLPAFVAVIGKLSVYTPEQGNTLVSIRAEDIAIVDESTRNIWLLETARATLDRIKALKTDAAIGDAVNSAYPGTKEDYKELVRRVLQDVKAAAPGNAAPPTTPPAQGPGQKVPPTEQNPPAIEPGKPVTIDEMKCFVEQKIITLNAANKGKGVRIESLKDPCLAVGIAPIQLDTAISLLMKEGSIYEPKLGLLIPAGGD